MLMRCAAALVGVRMTNESPSPSVRIGCVRSFSTSRSSSVASPSRMRLRTRRNVFVALPEHLLELESDIPAPSASVGTWKKNGPPNSFSRCSATSPLHDRRQLMQIAEQQQPHAAERLARPTAVDAQRLIDRPHQVGAHHRHLVDDDQLQVAHQTAVAAAADVVGADEAWRKAEEGVDRLPADVDRGEPGRRQHHRLGDDVVAQGAQQRRFAGAGAAGDEQVTFLVAARSRPHSGTRAAGSRRPARRPARRR